MKKAFEKSVPESQGIRSEGIMEFIHCMKQKSIELHTLSIMRHGKQVFECYWKPYNAETPHIMYSFSKSLTATAIGFAEQEGLLSLDEKLVDLFPDECPEEPSENLKKADIRSLLTMSCGHGKEIDWSDEHTDPNWIRDFLHHDFMYEPGTTFMYNTAGTNLLCAILAKKTGQQCTEYLKPRLFEPLGMSDITCIKMPDGTELGGAGMYMTLDDMTRFGMFLLNRGSWEGKQLLRTEWFDRACVKQIETLSPAYQTEADNWAIGYGFQCWMCKPERSFRADGAYGQFALVFPEEDLMVAVNSASFDANTLINAVYDTIMKGMSSEALPEDSAAYAKLSAFAETASVPALWGVRSLEAEQKYAGVIYTAEAGTVSFTDFAGGSGRAFKDGRELKALSFRFGQDRVYLQVTQGAHTDTMEAGFGGEFISREFMGNPYAASAMWISDHELLIHLLYMPAVAGARLLFDFREDGLQITRKSTLPAAMVLIDRGGDALTLSKQ